MEQRTVMLRNIGCSLSPAKVKAALDGAGMHGTFHFIIVPRVPSGRANPGYAFVCFRSNPLAEQCRRLFHGMPFEETRSKKICDVIFAEEERTVEDTQAKCRRRPGKMLGIMVFDEAGELCTGLDAKREESEEGREGLGEAGGGRQRCTGKRKDKGMMIALEREPPRRGGVRTSFLGSKNLAPRRPTLGNEVPGHLSWLFPKPRQPCMENPHWSCSVMDGAGWYAPSWHGGEQWWPEMHGEAGFMDPTFPDALGGIVDLGSAEVAADFASPFPDVLGGISDLGPAEVAADVASLPPHAPLPWPCVWSL